MLLAMKTRNVIGAFWSVYCQSHLLLVKLSVTFSVLCLVRGCKRPVLTWPHINLAAELNLSVYASWSSLTLRSTSSLFTFSFLARNGDCKTEKWITVRSSHTGLSLRALDKRQSWPVRTVILNETSVFCWNFCESLSLLYKNNMPFRHWLIWLDIPDLE